MRRLIYSMIIFILIGGSCVFITDGKEYPFSERVTVVPALRALAFLLRPAVRACGYIYDKTKRARGLRSARRGYGLKIPKKGK